MKKLITTLTIAITLSACTAPQGIIDGWEMKEIANDAREFMSARDKICNSGKFIDLLNAQEKAITCRQPKAEWP